MDTVRVTMDETMQSSVNIQYWHCTKEHFRISVIQFCMFDEYEAKSITIIPNSDAYKWKVDLKPPRSQLF